MNDRNTSVLNHFEFVFMAYFSSGKVSFGTPIVMEL